MDPVAESVVVDEWRALAAAGLSSALRPQPDEHHRPHVTVYAGESVPAEAEDELPGLMAGLDLQLRLGALMIFGPYRGRCILVRMIVPSVELLALQGRVAELCAADPAGPFGAGRWTPHVTLARRLPVEQLSSATSILSGYGGELDTRVRRCRRWDGERRTAWWLTD